MFLNIQMKFYYLSEPAQNFNHVSILIKTYRYIQREIIPNVIYRQLEFKIVPT